jgi:Asp/Glu/hydantoin racemase
MRADLRDQHGAEVLILGCAAMAGYRADLEVLPGLPVIDPFQMPITMAIGGLALATATKGIRG